MKDIDKISIMAEIAHMFFIDDISQIEIAKKFSFSRAKVSRILKKAKENNIVNIQINYPIKYSKYLSETLKNKYSLNDVIVVEIEHNNSDFIIKMISETAAKYIDDLLNDGDIIGLSWGKTMYQVVNSLKPKFKKNIHVIQITGGASESYDTKLDSPSLVRKMADIYNAKLSLLYAPLYVKNKIVKEELMKEYIIKKSLSYIKSLNYILTGIASMNSIEENSVTWAGFMDKNKKLELIKKGAVGYICGHFFDIHGNILNDVLEHNMIGIKIEELHNVKNIIAVSGGLNKYKAIYGALNGKLINSLITDSHTAKKLIDIK